MIEAMLVSLAIMLVSLAIVVSTIIVCGWIELTFFNGEE